MALIITYNKNMKKFIITTIITTTVILSAVGCKRTAVDQTVPLPGQPTSSVNPALQKGTNSIAKPAAAAGAHVAMR
jgi:hypothetical protein